MFTLKVETDNDAFQNGNRSYELAKIMQRAIARMEDGDTSGVCWDSNGNNVGEWELEIEEDEDAA